LYCSHAKQIREELNTLEQQAKVTLPTGNRRTLSQRNQRDKEKGKSKKITKARLGLMP